MDGPRACPQPPGLPAALGLQPGEAVPVSASLSVLLDGDRVVYFHFTDPVDSHAADDKPGRNRCLGRFALHGLASQAQLARALGVSPQTVGRARQRLEQEGEAGFAKPRKRRRRHGIDDPDLLAQAAAMLKEGRSVYSVARALGVSRSTLWRYTREGLLPASQVPPRGGRQAPASASAKLPGKEERNRRDATAVLGRATHDTAGRVAASLGLLDGREPRFEGGSAVSLGGVLTALPALLAAGLLRHAGHLQLPKGFYGIPSVLLLWAFLLLARVRNAEGLRYQQPGEWGALLGLDRCPCPRTLRRRTRQLADSPRLAEWTAALARDWCADDPAAVATLFIDGHVQVYSGRKGKLPKHFVARRKLALPAAVGYWAHALGGAPLLCLHRAVDDGMVSEIWNGIVPQLEASGLLPPVNAQRGQPCLAAGGEPRLTLVFDREGWSPRLFRELAARDIAVVTWIKGPQAERWPASEFRPAAIPVRTPLGTDTIEGQVAERKYDLGAGCEAREIRFWGDRRWRGVGKRGRPRKPRELAGQPGPGQRQPSILTTHRGLSAGEVAGLPRSRWTQENYFKYLRAEFGLDTLPEHALEEVDGEAWIVNPAWRRIDKALKQERNTVGHLRRKRAAQKDARSEAARELDTRIQACDRTIAGLERARRAADSHIQARDLPEGEKLQALPAALRQLHDTLRMIAYRAESAMALAVAPEMDSPDTARSLLKALFRSDASLRPDPAAGTLTVRLLHLATRAQDKALTPLLEELNRTRTVFPGTQLRLVYEMLPSDRPGRTVALPHPKAPTPRIVPP